MFNIILAHTQDSKVLNGKKAFGIGSNGKLPWNIKEELDTFKKITSNSAVIIGRKTWEHIPNLPDRLQIVLSKEKTLSRPTINGEETIMFNKYT